MAEIQQTQVLPAPFIEAAGKTYLEDLSKAVGGIKGLNLYMDHNLLLDKVHYKGKQKG
jgi:hypothetical protein